MGCGSSSLKGEKVAVETEEPTQAIKKIRTNFSDIDFTGQPGDSRRGKSFAVAPDEQRRPTRISEHYSEDPTSLLAKQGAGTTDGIVGDAKHHHADDGGKLQPYRSIEGDSDLTGPAATTTPKIHVEHAEDSTDPTSQESKSTFANANQPVSSNAIHDTHTKPQSEHQTPMSNSLDSQIKRDSLPVNTSSQRKKSWIQKYNDRVTGRNAPELTDEELMKYTGMTREQWNKYKADPKSGVGGNQQAGYAPTAYAGGGAM